MPRFACPKCKSLLKTTAEQAGEILVCDACGKKVRVPATKPAALAGAHMPAQADFLPEPAILPGQDTVHGRAAKTPPPPTKSRVTAPVNEEEEPDKDEDERDKARPRSMVTSIGGGLIGLLVLAGIILVLSGRWVDLLQRPIQGLLEAMGIHPLVAILITATIILVPAGLFLLHLIKSAILGAMPSDVEFRSAKPDQFKDLDRDKLADLTAAYESLGFRHLTDFTIEADVDLGNKGFARLFVHPEKHCFAEINQVFAGGQTVPMRSMLMTLLEDNWSVAITDRTPAKEGYLMRLPRAIWRSLPDEDPAALFQEMLKLRQALSHAMEVAVLTDDTAKAYFTREKTNTRARKDSVARRWALGIQIEFWLFDRNRKYEWLGQYRRKAARNAN